MIICGICNNEYKKTKNCNTGVVVFAPDCSCFQIHKRLRAEAIQSEIKIAALETENKKLREDKSK